MSKLRIENAELMHRLLPSASYVHSSCAPTPTNIGTKVQTEPSFEEPRFRLKSLIKKGITLNPHSVHRSESSLRSSTKPFF